MPPFGHAAKALFIAAAESLTPVGSAPYVACVTSIHGRGPAIAAVLAMLAAPLVFSVVALTAAAAVPPMAGGEANRLVKPVPLTAPEALSVVAFTPAGTLEPNAGGEAKLLATN